MDLVKAIEERQYRQSTYGNCIVRTDIAQKKTAEYWNHAGIPRTYSRENRKVKAFVLMRDSFRCVPGEMGLCACSGRLLSPSTEVTVTARENDLYNGMRAGTITDSEMTEYVVLRRERLMTIHHVDHVIPFSVNGPQSFIYHWNRPSTVRTVGNRLAVPSPMLVPGGYDVLLALYGTYAGTIASESYRAEDDPFNMQTTCSWWNTSSGETPKTAELDLVQETVSRQTRRIASGATYAGLSYDGMRSVLAETHRLARLRDASARVPMGVAQ